ncbi:MAG: AraC family transcriptional regulator [Nevskia sp.]
MTAMIRAESLHGYAALVTSLGGDPKRLLLRAGIDPVVLNRNDAFLPHHQQVQLVEDSAEQLACPDFGLRLAQRQNLEVLGLVAVAARSCRTMGDALALVERFVFVYAPALRFTTRPLPDRARLLLTIELELDRLGPRRQIMELAVGAMHSMLSNLPYHLMEVHFSHSRVAEPAAYRKCFGSPVRFEQAHDGLIIPAQDLKLPIHEHNPQLELMATAYLESQFPSPLSATSVRVRDTLKRLLKVGAGSHQEVAAALAMHPRTLQRRLRDEQTSFDIIKDVVRRDLARHYLEQSQLPLSHITALLGYSEQSALTRSCQRWFGQTPRSLRGAATPV